ncbi:hypothetical protein KR018_002627, partial [Drosophila ironensis]
FVASKAMEQLLAAVAKSSQQCSSPSSSSDTGVTTVSLEVAAASGNSLSRFRLGGQPILPPLMTGCKRREAQMYRQMAIELEEQYRLARCSAGSEASRGMSGTRRSVDRLQQTETFIYDSTQQGQKEQQQQQGQQGKKQEPIKEQTQEKKQEPRQEPRQDQRQEPRQEQSQEPRQGRPTSLGLGQKVPTILVDPPTPLEVLPGRHKANRITDRILKFEISGVGNFLPDRTAPLAATPSPRKPPSPPKKCILRSSTSPALAPMKDAPPAALEPAAAALPPTGGIQRSRSFTLEEPSQVLVEHMQRTGMAMGMGAGMGAGLAGYQQDTVESKAKRVSWSPRGSCSSQSSGSCTRWREKQELPERELEIEQMVKKALDKHGTVEASRRASMRKYLLGHSERLLQLVQHQEEERRRLQAEFDRQQRHLIDSLCAEINESGTSESQVSEYTSTADLERQMTGLSDRTPSWSSGSNTLPLDPLPDESLTAEVGCRLKDCTSRKRLFVAKGYESEPPPVGTSSAATTPRSVSMPLRNSSLSNSRRRSGSVASPPRTRSQSRGAGSPRKGAANGGTLKSPVRVPGGGGVHGIRKGSLSSGGAATVPVKGTAKATGRQSIEQRDPEVRREWAATKINAACRGYLVRRLFNTEQVQRVVQTIRDTLIFVLNLHLETCNGLEDEGTANLRLKAQLLQQLCSASRTLHLIFFRTTIKERMDIIARDRKRIKNKLLATHLKQR